jgi:mRNA-degrading endonuclease RelE of RelBE toxin-antitoxin system
VIAFAFQIRWRSRAIKDLERLPKRDRARIVEAVERYARSSEGDVQKLRGTDPPEQRLRVGDYRIRFHLDTAVRIMTILRVLPRDKAYRVREPVSKFGDEVEVSVAWIA